MKSYEVIAIKKEPHHQDPYTAIQAVCCKVTILGGNYHFSQQKAIQMINNKEAEFYVHKDKRVDVLVGSRDGKTYLKTEKDGYESNNLLELPGCICKAEK